MPSHQMHRAVRVASRTLVWTVGPIAVALRGPLAELTTPQQCTGVIDLLALAIMRTWPDLPIGRLLIAIHVLAVTLALGCFSEAVLRTTDSVAVTIAITIALAISRVFPHVLALPGETAAFGVCAIVIVAGRRFIEAEWPPPSGAWTLAPILLLAASMVPAWTLVCTVLAVAVITRNLPDAARPVRFAASALAATALVCVPIVIVRMTQPAALDRGVTWSLCVLPNSNLGMRVMELARSLSPAGAVVFALAALGIWVQATKAGLKRSLAGAAVLALAVLPGAADAGHPEIAAAPLILVFWLAASIGLLDVMRLMGSGRARAVGATVAVMSLPLFQWSVVRAEERDNVVRSLGHERASLREIRSALNLVPDGARIVEEDASVDLLMRAALFRRRPHRPFEVILPSRPVVLSALSRGVYAFPSGQQALNLRGFVIDAVTEPTEPGRRVPGLAVIRATRACAELGGSWVDLAGIGASGRVALSAPADAAQGPVVVYLSGADGYLPGADGWPIRVVRGFDLRIFSRRTAEESARLEAEAAANGLQDRPVFMSLFVVRLTLHRTPGAPLALAIALGPPRSDGVGRLVANSEPALPLTLCDAPNVGIAGF